MACKRVADEAWWRKTGHSAGELMPDYVPNLKRRPSEVMQSENFFISCDPDQETLPYVTERIGASHILYAADYPHFDGRLPNTVKLTAGRSEFSEEIQRKILADNPARLYRKLR